MFHSGGGIGKVGQVLLSSRSSGWPTMDHSFNRSDCMKQMVTIEGHMRFSVSNFLKNLRLMKEIERNIVKLFTWFRYFNGEPLLMH